MSLPRLQVDQVEAQAAVRLHRQLLRQPEPLAIRHRHPPRKDLRVATVNHKNQVGVLVLFTPQVAVVVAPAQSDQTVLPEHQPVRAAQERPTASRAQASPMRVGAAAVTEMRHQVALANPAERVVQVEAAKAAATWQVAQRSLTPPQEAPIRAVVVAADLPKKMRHPLE